MKRGKIAFIHCLFICLLVLLASPATDAKAALADGTYSISYTVLSGDDDSVSIANDYFVKPAKLIVENGSMKVQLTLKNSEWITSFKAANGGNGVISTNSSANTRVIQFNVSSLSSPTSASITVNIDDMDYHHNYTIRLKFDESSATLTSAPAKETASAESTNETVINQTADETETAAEVVENPQTSDSSMIALFVMFMLASAVLLVKRFSNR